MRLLIYREIKGSRKAKLMIEFKSYLALLDWSVKIPKFIQKRLFIVRRK